MYSNSNSKKPQKKAPESKNREQLLHTDPACASQQNSSGTVLDK